MFPDILSREKEGLTSNCTGRGKTARHAAIMLRNNDRKLTMPTILVILGWRLFFYANEGNEPIHVHCRKGDMECKYWLYRESFDIEEAFSYHMSEKDKRQI